MAKTLLVIIILLVCISCIISVSNVYPSCGMGIDCANGYSAQAESSQIVISRYAYPQINIVIYAPDFNSNPYAIDTIGEDGSTVTISTRGASIPYRLVETGPDTGYFTGYVTLSSTTSTCSPVCGPTDGFLAAGGDDAITVSFTYANGRTISASSHDNTSIQINHSTIHEFPFTGLELFAGMTSLIFFSKVISMK